MQRLVTIYLDTQVYMEGRWVAASFGDKHGRIEEHLSEELREGWRVVSIAGFGGSTDGPNTRGWFAVVLEK